MSTHPIPRGPPRRYPPDVSQTDVSSWVKRARESKKWSQERLGEELGLQKATISHWERGRHKPSFGQMEKIRDLTGFPLQAVSPSDDWPLPLIRRERITALTPEQLNKLQIGILGLLAAITSKTPLQEEARDEERTRAR